MLGCVARYRCSHISLPNRDGFLVEVLEDWANVVAERASEMIYLDALCNPD